MSFIFIFSKVRPVRYSFADAQMIGKKLPTILTMIVTDGLASSSSGTWQSPWWRSAPSRWLSRAWRWGLGRASASSRWLSWRWGLGRAAVGHLGKSLRLHIPGDRTTHTAPSSNSIFVWKLYKVLCEYSPHKTQESQKARIIESLIPGDQTTPIAKVKINLCENSIKWEYPSLRFLY